MITKFVRVKRRVVLLGLVVALLATGAAPLLGGQGTTAAEQARKVHRFENTEGPIRFFDGGLSVESTIEVSGIGTTLVEVEVSLFNINFIGDSSQDMDVFLVGPDGGAAMILSDVGGATTTRNVSLVLKDGASQPLPGNAALTSGTFKPTNLGTEDDVFDTGSGPFVATTDPSLRNAFFTSNPNGTWRLFASDDTANGMAKSAGINGGWGLTITTNREPTAKSDRFQVQAGKTLRVPAAGVLKNDSDPDGLPLIAILAKKPKQGTVKLRDDGSFTYTPNKNAKGTDRFTYRAMDAHGATALATVTIQIKA